MWSINNRHECMKNQWKTWVQIMIVLKNIEAKMILQAWRNIGGIQPKYQYKLNCKLPVLFRIKRKHLWYITSENGNQS